MATPPSLNPPRLEDPLGPDMNMSGGPARSDSPAASFANRERKRFRGRAGACGTELSLDDAVSVAACA